MQVKENIFNVVTNNKYTNISGLVHLLDLNLFVVLGNHWKDSCFYKCLENGLHLKTTSQLWLP